MQEARRQEGDPPGHPPPSAQMLFILVKQSVVNTHDSHYAGTVHSSALDLAPGALSPSHCLPALLLLLLLQQGGKHAFNCLAAQLALDGHEVIMMMMTMSDDDSANWFFQPHLFSYLCLSLFVNMTKIPCLVPHGHTFNSDNNVK